MSILTESLPTTVKVAGRDISIQSGFRIMLRIDAILQSDRTPEEMLAECFRIFYGCVPKEIEEATESMIWFYLCGEDSRKRKKLDEASQDGMAEESEQGPPPTTYYSFDYDAKLIYAAFMQQYGIDLTCENLHWWQFKALFEAISDETLFSEVRKCRAIQITSDMTSKQQQYYREMKKRYALPVPEEERELNDRLTEALMNGGDVSEVLASYGAKKKD